MHNNREKDKIHRAGVIPYYISDGVVNMLFMRPTTENKPYMVGKDKWQIAKGRIDDTDASTRDAALREAKEELGLWEGNVLQCYEVGTYMGRTTIYAAEVEDITLFSVPDPEETAETKWLTNDLFFEEGRELHRNVVSSVNNIILTHHGLVDPVHEEEPHDEYDPFENPLAFDKWGNRVNYDINTRRRRR